MKTFFLTATLILVCASLTLAVPASKKLEFSKSSMGKVTFDGKLHNKAAKSCKECHNKETFPKMKQGTVSITMDQIYAGKLCGICHNGQKAFAAKANCNRCHKR